MTACTTEPWNEELSIGREKRERERSTWVMSVDGEAPAARFACDGVVREEMPKI
jgi:hypothetical protein